MQAYLIPDVDKAVEREDSSVYLSVARQTVLLANHPIGIVSWRKNEQSAILALSFLNKEIASKIHEVPRHCG